MATHSMRPKRWLNCGGVLVAALVAMAPGPAPAPATTQPAVAELTSARIKLAEEAYQIQLSRYQRGLCSKAEAFGWLRKVARARIEADGSNQELVAFLKDYVKQARNNAAETARRHEQGVTDVMQVYEARDMLLEAQLWLAKAQVGQQDG